MYYDYTLTFAREVELFWKRHKLSWPFILFVANRYIIVFGHIPAFSYSFWRLTNRVSCTYPGLLDGSSKFAYFVFLVVIFSVAVARTCLQLTANLRCTTLRLYDQVIILVAQFIAAGKW
ncbi:hypothetical protein ID866_8380 [Astraeus odoratus]|nr:hypothetical protein ID866_8380 [Astraeus odoratus]